jgi:hypothetical protein
VVRDRLTGLKKKKRLYVQNKLHMHSLKINPRKGFPSLQEKKKKKQQYASSFL